MNDLLAALHRFCLQLFCLWLVIYGPPILALQETAQERQAQRPEPPSPPRSIESTDRPRSVDPADLDPEDLAKTPKADLDAIPFVPSWNLLSIPETPASTSPADVLAPIAGLYEKAWHYDACSPDVEKWRLYDPSDPSGSTLESLDPTKGFWLDATQSGALPSSGILPQTTTWHLCEGWNLIGFPAGQARHVKTTLQSIEGKYSMVYGYDPTDAEDPWAIYDVTAPTWANDLTTFEVGRGYWILVTEDVDLTIPNVADPPTVSLATPTDLLEITGPVNVVGSASSPLLDYWRVASRLVGEEKWTQLAIGYRPVDGEILARFDPTLLLNGMYELKLEAVDHSGQIVEDRIAVSVDGQMKIGHFTLSFVDLQIPLSGLDIQIVRTYDSRDRRLGDFGVGWALDIRQGLYQNNRPPGDGWRIPATEGPWGLPCSVVQETKSHLTTIRLSDQEIYRFRLVLKQPGTVIGGCFAEAEFEWVDGPLPGTRLEILGNSEVIYQNNADGVLDKNTLQPFVPEDVKLTTRDGRIFHLDLQDGVTHLEDLHGNTLDITPDGITHSSGRGVEFVRADDGKIEEIIDPRGHRNVYSYDGNNDLIRHTDRAEATTDFTYRDHYLEEIHNAYGLRAVRTEYDRDGRMVKMIDASGRALSFDHDLVGRREIVTNRLGFTRVMEYDDRGNVTLEINENGEKTIRTYDGDDQLLTEKNDLGHVTTYEYTPSNDLKSIKDPLGHVTSFTYHALGAPETITDPLMHTTTNHYKANGELEWTKDALDHQTDFTYNDRGELETLTDALGHATTFEYDAYGNVKKEIDALGHATVHTYDDHGNRLTSTTTRTLPDGTLPDGEVETLVTRFTYDALDRLVATTAPDGTVTQTGYDLLGRVTRQVNERRRTTLLLYDEQGRHVQTIYPDGTSMQNRYDREGRRIASEDPLGRVTRYAYDPVGRLLSATYPGPDEPTVTNEYDRAGRLVKTLDERGNPTRFVYDDAGRRTKIIDALGQETVSVYDDAGRLESITDARDLTTTYEYDDAGRLRFVIAPDQSKVETIYDALGRRTASIDQEGKRTNFVHDALGRLTQVKDALDQVTSYAYDEVGNFISQTDANGHTTRFTYDPAGRRTERILPDGAAERFLYEDGVLQTHIAFTAAYRKFTYDDRGRVVERRYPDGLTHTFTYTKTGRRVTAEDHRGNVTTYEYDERDRLVKKIDPTGHRLEYAYDLAGNRTSLTAHIGDESFTTTYTHDALNRVETVTDPSGGVYVYKYDPNSRPERLESPNGVVTTWTYDTQNRLEDLVTRDPAGEILQSYHYTTAKTGHRTRIDERGGAASGGVTRSYVYDDLWRLTQDQVTDAEGLVYREDFQYDPVGNRLRRDLAERHHVERIDVWTYDSRDRIETHNGRRWLWDRGGRVREQPGWWDQPDKTYRWWLDDHLLEATTADGTTVTAGYNTDGARIESTETVRGQTETTAYLVDDSGWLSHVVADIRDNNTTVYTRNGDQLLGLTRDTPSYYHPDGLGSIRALTDPSGTVTEELDYSAFGRLLNGDLSVQRYTFTGEPRSAMGLSYHRARWMDPRLGRFLSMDPVLGQRGSPATLNKYSYASLSPLYMTDPTGLFAISSAVFVAAISVAALPNSVNYIRVYRTVFIRVRAIKVSEAWSDAEILTQIDRAKSIFKKYGIILEIGKIEDSDLPENLTWRSLDESSRWLYQRASSIVPVYFIDRHNACSEGESGFCLGNWEGQAERKGPAAGSVWLGRYKSTNSPPSSWRYSGPGPNDRNMAHELMHAIGGVPDPWSSEGLMGRRESDALTRSEVRQLLRRASHFPRW